MLQFYLKLNWIFLSPSQEYSGFISLLSRRHGRKSSSQKFNGYKGHLTIDTKPGGNYLYKKSCILLFSLILILTIGGCEQISLNNNTDDNSPEVLNYFPLYENMIYRFAGEGMEFAAFNREIMYINDDKNELYAQIHDATTGTIVANIFKLQPEQVSLIYQQPEFYTDDNLLEKIKNDLELKEEIILKHPIEEGNSWESEGKSREIISIDNKLNTEAGKFYNVIKIKVENLDSNNDFTTYEYYAKNIGLIRRKNIGENYKIISDLKTFGMKIDNENIVY